MLSKHGFETTAARTLLMRKIKSKNTRPEMLLRKTLWKLGYRYRLHTTAIPGKPDLVFKSKKVVVFVDGEFWHGYKWEDKKPKIKANPHYWIKKIEGNMQRDLQNQKKLTEMGYTVIRFWEHEIRKDMEGCLVKLLGYLKEG